MKNLTNLKQLSILLLFSLCASMIFTGCEKKEPQPAHENTPLPETVHETIDPDTADVTSKSDSMTSTETSTKPSTAEMESGFSPLTEDDIYSYLQGIKSFEKGNEWAGSWCYEEAGGQQFSQFGCGVCCLSNMYSTLYREDCPPDIMYQWAQQYSNYTPDAGVGALSWDQLVCVCNSLDIPCELSEKPADYAEFQQMAASNQTLLVLVSSNNDDTIWQNVPGHYVNLWLYDAETDTVFLTDSKGPKNNRCRVPLSDVYAALKTSSSFQVLKVP